MPKLKLVGKVLHDLRNMVERIAEGLVVRPRRMAKTGIIRRNQVILGGEVG